MLLGTFAEPLGIFIVLVAGTKLVPPSLLQTLEAMDANRTGALVTRSDVGYWYLLQMVRGTFPINKRYGRSALLMAKPTNADDHDCFGNTFDLSAHIPYLIASHS